MSYYELVWNLAQLAAFTVCFIIGSGVIGVLFQIRMEHDENMERIRRVPANKLVPDWVDHSAC